MKNKKKNKCRLKFLKTPLKKQLLKEVLSLKSELKLESLRSLQLLRVDPKKKSQLANLENPESLRSLKTPLKKLLLKEVLSLKS